MPLQKQIIPFSFQGGMDTKTDPLQVRPPALLELQNTKFDKIGALNKRPGYDLPSRSVTNGSTINTAVAIDSFNNELNLFDNQSIYTYIDANDTWANRGPAISVINTNYSIIRSQARQQLNPDVSQIGDLILFVWEDSLGGCRYSILDNDQQTFCAADQLLQGSIQRPKTIIFNNLFYIFYTSNNNLYFRTVSPNNPDVISPQINLIFDGAANFVYDVCVAPNANTGIGQQVCVAYNSTALQVLSFDETNTIIATNTGPTTAIEAINIYNDSQTNLWISYSTGTNVQVVVTDGLFNVILTNTIIDTVVCPTLAGIESTNAGVLQLIYEVTIDPLNTSNEMCKSITITTTGVITVVGQLLSVGLASKPFNYNGNLFVNLAFQSALQSTYFMVFLTESPFTICGKVSPEVGGGLRTNNMLSEVSQLVPGMIVWANLVKGRFISEDNTSFSLLGVNASLADFTDVNKFNSVTFSDNLLFVGGILQNYDGISVNEQNFHIFPEFLNLDPNYPLIDPVPSYVTLIHGAGALSAGQYQYQVLYAWADRFGQIQYSTPSPAFTVTTQLNDAVQITIPTCRLTSKTGVTIQVYRTQVNQVVFQEVTSNLAILHNNPNVNTVVLTDVLADINLAGSQTIYTTGGVLPNSAPPSTSMISLYNDRVFLGGLEDKNLLWFSKNKVNNSNSNTIPVEFTQFNTIGVNQLGGPITALGLMDQNLIIFKKNAIFILTGTGPNDEGGDTPFQDPQLITSSVGCVNPNSIILTTEGIFFQTPNKGIWMLPRSLGTPVYVGSGVNNLALQYQVSSAVLDPNSNSIIMTTYNGPALVYDYLIQQWSTWTNQQAIDAVVFNGVFTFCKPNGQVYIQNPSIFYDGIVDGYQVPISMELITPWLSFSQVLGYQRIYSAFILGSYLGAHNLNVEIGYDFNPAFTASTIINATLLPGSNVWGSDPLWGTSTPWGGTWSPYIVQVNMPIQKCTAFRIKLFDSQLANDNNEGLTLSSMLFELGQLPQGIRLPKTNKFAAT